MPSNLSLIDRIIVGADKSLRAVIPHSNQGARPLPVDSASSPNTSSPNQDALPELSINESRHVAGLMRINHTGEVCAQGLYHGQAFTAKNEQVRQAMQHSADEEVDHLVWCETRLRELGSHPSVFTPVWYGLSFGLGAVAGIVSNEFSLGFVAETEAQVSEHLEDHITQLPPQDTRSKAILAQMNIEELAHRQTALDYGGQNLSKPVKISMRWLANRMKNVAYHF